MHSEIRDLGMFGTRNSARRLAGIPNWGHSDLGAQSGHKNQPACDDSSDLAVIAACYTVIHFARLVFNSSFPVCADVVFFHGLLGGPFITWRQQDRPAKRLSLAAAGKHNSVDSDCTACWPKVLLSY